jgi:hypothetical protein
MEEGSGNQRHSGDSSKGGGEEEGSRRYDGDSNLGCIGAGLGSSSSSSAAHGGEQQEGVQVSDVVTALQIMIGSVDVPGRRNNDSRQMLLFNPLNEQSTY